jgi:hypothetical protein
MTSADHDASRPAPGPVHRAPDLLPDADPPAQQSNSAEERLRRSPHSSPQKPDREGEASQRRRAITAAPSLSLGERPADKVVDALHALGTPNRVDHDRLVGVTATEQNCGKAMHTGISRSTGRPATWPDFCRSHAHEEPHCMGYWAEEWATRADLAFHDCAEMQVLLTQPENMDSLHRSIRNQTAAGPRVYRLTIRMGGVNLILTNAPIKPTSKGVIAAGVAAGNEAGWIVERVLKTFHLDGRDRPDSKRGSASEPVLPSVGFPERAHDPPWKCRRHSTPDAAARYRDAWNREMAMARHDYPDLPTDFRTLERDHLDLLIDVHENAMRAAEDD